MRHPFYVLLLAVAAWLTSSAAFAENAADCARIADQQERLACFDRVFPRAGTAEPRTSATDPTVDAAASDAASGQSEAAPQAAAPGVVTGAGAAAAPSLPESESGQPPKPAAEPASPPMPARSSPPPAIPAGPADETRAAEAAAVAEAPEPSKGGLFGDPKINLTSTIVALRSGEKQKMVFLLENEQVWMQSSPRPLPFREGDTVTIKSATFGGYIMRSSSGTGTRVQRIR